VAIRSPDKATRLDQLRTLAKVQVWSGFCAAPQIRAEVYDAVVDEVKDVAEAQALTDAFLASATEELVAASSTWPSMTDFDRLQAAFSDLERADLVVVQACDDHWAADEVLQAGAAEGRPPRGVVFFTHTDVWHAVEHGMLELNVWHGDSANVAASDELLVEVTGVLERHGLTSLFDEGRLEVTLSWQRRPQLETNG